MSGSLGEWSIEDLLQIARITHKTTCIEVKSPHRSGLIFLSDGAVIAASVDGVTPAGGSRFSQVVEAIEALAAIDDGSFEFVARPSPEVNEPPIDVPAVAAAMEKDALREQRLAEMGLDRDEGLGVGRHLAAPLTLKPTVWQLIADLVEPFTLGGLESKMGRRKAVATLLTLEAIGLLERGLDTPDRDVPAPASEPLPQDEPRGDEGERPGSHERAFEIRSGEPAIAVPGETTGEPGGDTGGGPAESSPGEVPESPVVPADVPDPVIDRVDERADQIVFEPALQQDATEPIVEIFGLEEEHGEGPWRSTDMHEVVSPSETTLVSDVLGDMRSRFRQREFVYQDDED